MATRRRRAPYSLSPVHLDRGGPTPLYRQIAELLRRDLLRGVLRAGQRLASTRVLAEDLGVSRNTVLEAIDQLTAEGYLVGRVGSGTYVVDDLPEDFLQVSARSATPAAIESPPLSRRGLALRSWATGDSRRGLPFQLGRPALDLFPRRTWSRLLARRARDLPREFLDYSEVEGYLPLREHLALHLRAARGVECDPRQVLVVRGSQQGVDLVARVLLDPGDRVWMEDPGYPAARAALTAAGAVEVPVPVDEEGIDVEAGLRRAPDARLAYVTPSHQYPLGVTMSLSRRLGLIRWARRARAWILEDDYDSEYRFSGRPLAALAGLDGGRNVLYLGTLSKVLFPGLRVGYLVVPRRLVDAFRGARAALDRCAGLLEQVVLSDFFEEGHFDRHLRRTRKAYAERQEALGRALAENLAHEIELRPSAAGLHDIGWLRRHEDDARIADRAVEAKVLVGALSRYCREVRLPPGLLFGYAGFPPDEITAAAERLATVLRS